MACPGHCHSMTRTLKPRISIVVDDLGDNSVIARQMSELPIPLTMAILPKTPQAKKIAYLANRKGHEVIMHLPMEAFTRPDLLGPGAIFAAMSESEIDVTIRQDAGSIPFMVGFNNHMGSLLTESRDKMKSVMKIAKTQNWYFLDSRTSESSVAREEAEGMGIPSIGRDVFLDHHSANSRSSLSQILNQRLKQAKAIARSNGQVVVICHPYPETYAFLNEWLPEIREEFEFVKLSDLIVIKNEKLKRISHKPLRNGNITGQSTAN